ncbi:NADPH-dependent 1-acyldihydroxyacetone phosphate reductase [Diaporthe eres]|nr:NADPH-dependent 1-acyldihydroxyacetone phosphate reductase [Diaporthe eres]
MDLHQLAREIMSASEVPGFHPSSDAELTCTGAMRDASSVQAFAPLLIKGKGMAVYITSVAGYINVPVHGIDVLEVVTGAVNTNGQMYLGDSKLPYQSL